MMKDFMEMLWGNGKGKGASSDKKDMSDVMRRVDDQIGRAVTRLSER